MVACPAVPGVLIRPPVTGQRVLLFVLFTTAGVLFQAVAVVNAIWDDTSMPDLELITENRHKGAPTTSGNVVIASRSELGTLVPLLPYYHPQC